MAASVPLAFARRSGSRGLPVATAPRETLEIVSAAVQMTAMPEPVRQLIDTLLQILHEDESVIAALKASHAELQQTIFEICGTEESDTATH